MNEMRKLMETISRIEEGSDYGVYRKSKQQLDGPDGHSSSESAKVKRGGKHVTFKSKKEADKWVKDNAKGENMFVRKASKPVKESYFSELDIALNELVRNNPNLSADKLVAIARSKYGQEAASYLSDRFEREGDYLDYDPRARAAHDPVRKHMKDLKNLREYEEEMSYDEFVEYYVGDLSRSIVRKGVFTKLYDAAGQDIDVLNDAIRDQAESIADSYYGSGEGIGTSDMNHFIQHIGKSLGVDDVFGWYKKKEDVEEGFRDKVVKGFDKIAAKIHDDPEADVFGFMKPVTHKRNLRLNPEDAELYKQTYSIDESDEEGIKTPELFDREGYHLKVRKGEFRPSSMLDGKVVLHDLENVSPTTGEAKIVTFDNLSLAKDAAKQFGGIVVRTALQTYRIVPNRMTEESIEEGGDDSFRWEDEFIAFIDGDAAGKAAKRDLMKSDEEMERDKVKRYAKYNKAIRGRKGLGEERDFFGEEPNTATRGDSVIISGNESGYDGERGKVIGVKGGMNDLEQFVIVYSIRLYSEPKVVEIETQDFDMNDYDHDYDRVYKEFVESINEEDDDLDSVFVGDKLHGIITAELAKIMPGYEPGAYGPGKGNTYNVLAWNSEKGHEKEMVFDPDTMSFVGTEDDFMLSNPFEARMLELAGVPVKEAKGKGVNVPPEGFASSEEAEKFIHDLGPDDEVDDYVVDPETGEVIFEPFMTKRGVGMDQFKSARDRVEKIGTWVPSIYGASNQDDAWEELGDLRYGNSSAAKFYNIVWRNLGDLLGSPKDLGTDAEEWEELDYDTGYDVPVAIKRKDGKKMQEEDYDNFRELAKLVKHATGNISLSMMGTTDKGTVVRFTPTLM